MCGYPVPEWLKTGACGGGYIGHPDYNGADCATFKSRAEVAEEQKVDK